MLGLIWKFWHLLKSFIDICW